MLLCNSLLLWHLFLEKLSLMFSRHFSCWHEKPSAQVTLALLSKPSSQCLGKCMFYNFYLRHKEVFIHIPLMLDVLRSRFCKSSHLLTNKHLKSYKYDFIILFSFRFKRTIAAQYHPLGTFESKRYIKDPKNKIKRQNFNL